MAFINNPKGVHLVGSVPLANCCDVFKTASNILGKHIVRIPDGETGARTNWIDWQLPLLTISPQLELCDNDAYEYTQRNLLTLVEGGDIGNLGIGNIGYADAALESYAEFKQLKSSGYIPANCRFQVSLPTPLATTHCYVHPSIQPAFEKQYEAVMVAELNRILEKVSHNELAIQWDTAVEFALLEGVMPTSIESLEQGISERLIRLTTLVPEPIELGFHLCYGDSQHKHFCEPEDMTWLVKVANWISSSINRSLNWVHMPVPQSRDDDGYFRPLTDLKLPDSADLFLGLVHMTDGEAGAEKRIDAASRFYSTFGVATECGFGRRPAETVERLMNIHANVSGCL